MVELFFLAALEITAIYFAWTAVRSARTSQGSLAWVVFLVAAPFVAVPLFLFLGHHRFKGYLLARGVSEKVASGIALHGEQFLPSQRPDVNALPFEKISGLPITRGNDIRLLIDGPATFEAIFSAIETARHYVLVQFYIVHDDDLGRALKDHLVSAAKRGVHVRFLVDPVGSYGLPTAYYQDLLEAGVQVADPKHMRGPKFRFQINFRNHRKTVIVDGEVGFTGGLNVGDEYMGRDPSFGAWRDTHAELRGPVVTQLQLVFAEDWHWATEDDSFEGLNWQETPVSANRTALIVPTGPADRMETGQMFYFSALAAARERVWIASPYFVPDRDILTALKHAALRGVDVRILLPDTIDHYIPWLAAFAYFDELREVGVNIYRYQGGFMHQKTVLVDGSFAGVGTSNLDNRSFRLNFETMAVFFDDAVASDTARMLEQDFDRAYILSTPLRDQSWKVRIGAPIARLFSPLL